MTSPQGYPYPRAADFPGGGGEGFPIYDERREEDEDAAMSHRLANSVGSMQLPLVLNAQGLPFRPPCEPYMHSPPPVCPIASRSAGREAVRALRRMMRDSQLFGSQRQCRGGGSDKNEDNGAVGEERVDGNIALIAPTDLIVGRMLGRGGFSEVHEARLASSFQGDGGIEGGEVASKGYRHRYAVKYLRRTVMENRKKYERGAADLAIEAKLLSAMEHPHIIRLHGITAGNLEENIARGRECSFFLVLDRLYDTLEDRIEAWRDIVAKCSGLLYRATHDIRGCKRRAMVIERLCVSLDLADAVRYLHEKKRVAFRDIKPENVGFDSRGILKLFDFGLAKELKPTRRLLDGTYRLTGNTGSRRYMAPEVAKAQPYNLSADAYSFGILLWEMCALEKPFRGYSEARHMEEVVEGGCRPPIEARGEHSHWPVRVQELIEACWRSDLHSRPTFAEIEGELRASVGEDDGSRHRRGLRSSGSVKMGSGKRVGSFGKLVGGEAA